MARQSGLSNSDYLVVGGWHVTIGPHGIELAKAGTAGPRAPLRQRRADGFLPEPFADLLGYEHETETALAALNDQQLVEIYGPCGIGKSSLLGHLAYRAATTLPDLPIVYVQAAGQTLADLLQTLFVLLYQANVRHKPAYAQLSHELRRAQAILLLDDVELGSQDLAELLRAVANCQVVFTSRRRRLATEGRSIELAGLDVQASSQLVVQALGRGLQGGEHADIQQLSSLFDGHPLRLLQATALVRETNQTFAGLIAALQGGDPVKVLQQLCAAGLSAQQRQVVAVLALTTGMLLPISLVEAMSSVSGLGVQVRELRDRAVVEQRRDRCGLPVCSLGEPRRLIGALLDQPLALRNLAEWLEHSGNQPDELLSVSGAVLTLVEAAGEAGEWETAIRLVRAVEPVLILDGRWEAWRYALDQGVRAARQADRPADQAYFLHQIGSGQLALENTETALRVLEEALRLRKTHDTRAAAAVTRRHLNLARAAAPAQPDPRPVRNRRGLKMWVAAASAALSAVALIGLIAKAVETTLTSRFGPLPHIAEASSPTIAGFWGQSTQVEQTGPDTYAGVYVGPDQTSSASGCVFPSGSYSWNIQGKAPRYTGRELWVKGFPSSGGQTCRFGWGHATFELVEPNVLKLCSTSPWGDGKQECETLRRKV